MNPDSITPAIPKDETPQTELSAEDFQRSLFAWFEERGLLAELRAHLRVQMIGALRGSSPGLASRTVSPKAQAVNLLVAEYLMENEYLYALSVFSCEASLVMKRDEKQRRFEEKEMWEILETLGVLRGSEAGRRVASRYLSENGECLLCCLLRKQDSFVGCFELDKAKGCVEERPVKGKYYA